MIVKIANKSISHKTKEIMHTIYDQCPINHIRDNEVE